MRSNRLLPVSKMTAVFRQFFGFPKKILNSSRGANKSYYGALRKKGIVFEIYYKFIFTEKPESC